MRGFIALLLSLIFIFRVSSSRKISLTSHDKELIVRVHNILRGSLPNVPYKASNMLLMRWNTDAADKAQKWADTCAREHDPMTDRRFGHWHYVGQNYAGTGYGLEKTLLYMYSEYLDYDFRHKKCKSGKVCGHFTQMIWHNSDEIGCGIADCSKKGGYTLQLFCNYVPMGNYRGQFPYSIGRSCSECPETHPYCINNLCSKYSKDPTMQGLTLSGLKKRTCVFPFEYEGKMYPDCKDYRGRTWCSEDGIFNKDYHYCKNEKKPCVFPFEYEGKKYDSCIPTRNGKSWCSEISELTSSRDWHFCGEVEED